MDVIKEAVVKGQAKVPSDSSLTQSSLNDIGMTNLNLRDYQLFGVNWLYNRFRGSLGAILCDEMGLGKTCQTISFLLTVTKKQKKSKTSPHLVVCPLSVINNWSDEFEKFSPSLTILRYIGDKDARKELRERLKEPLDVVLTTYELCLKDEEFLEKVAWTCLVVDEGHRLKNMESQLHEMLACVQSRYILTGTPVQNNPSELFSLLHFVNPKIFRRRHHDGFTEHFADENDTVSAELLDLLKPFLLRRLKEDVLKDLPSKNEVILFHPISALQKKYYKAILLRDYDAFEGAKKTRLMNILMQLRKCINHPYLFPGVEPEPFELGEHLVRASGKLLLIDKLLSYLKSEGHKVLLFSQFTSMLDILQDYMDLRGFAYERLDGSVRSEERFLAVKNFNQDAGNFVFLVSTKAGGQGLNLVSADTVVFVDSDFNPQNDLQAAARAHRIGQTRPVRIIRLVGRHTVEEIVLRRAEAKLRLTSQVLEGGHFSLGVSTDEETTGVGNELKDILRFGIRKLLEEEEEEESYDFEELLGGSEGGEWLAIKKKEEEREEAKDDDEDEKMYVFEGKDYSKELSTKDQKAFESMVLKEQESANSAGDYPLRRTTTTPTALLPALPAPSRRVRKPLTPEQLAERKRKREEKLERERHEAAEKARKRKEKQKERLRKLWEAASYTSLSVELVEKEKDEEEDEEDDDDEDKAQAVNYVIGDVAHPQKTKDADAIICHCVDDSGIWGSGGVFDAISLRSPTPSRAYRVAGNMEDLKIADVHLVECDDLISRGDKGHDFVAFLVAHQRDDSGRLKPLSLRWLEECLRKVAQVALHKKASVHLPRLGHNTPSFNWYGVERCIKKYLADVGVPTYIYYHPRRGARAANGSKAGPSKTAAKDSRKNASESEESMDETDSAMPMSTSTIAPKRRKKLPDISDSEEEEEPTPKRSKRDVKNLKGTIIHLRGVKHPGSFVKKVENLGGRLARNMNTSVTHVVIGPSSNPEDKRGIDPSVHLVSLSWLETTLDTKCRATEEDFPVV